MGWRTTAPRRIGRLFALALCVQWTLNPGPIASAQQPAAPAAPPAAGRGAGAPAGPVGGGRGGGFALGPAMTTPKPVVPNAKPVRSCESLAAVALPNTTIESAAADPNNAEVCRVTAVTTHPPMGDQVRIWVAIPMANWNGRFLG